MRAVQLFETRVEFSQQYLFTWIPIFEMALLARLIEVLRGVPQLVHVLALDDFQHLEPDVPERFNLGIPEDRVVFELRLDLRRRQLCRFGAVAVVVVSSRSEWTRDFQQ